MTKTAKNKEILQQLHDLVTKTASAPKPVATGVPGKEPNSEAVSEKHDTVNQNAVKPENNTPQNHGQKPSTDASKPTGGKKAEDETPAADATPKVADEAVAGAPEKVATDKEIAPEASPSVEKLGKEILELVQKFANNPVATGVPGKDPNSHSVSEKHDHVDQNAVKPENNNPQNHGQKPATDPSVPVAHAKSAQETEKAASYELGRLWGELVLKQAYDQQLEQIKTAGRRDFEVLVAQAAEQLKVASKPTEKVASAVEAEKQAEAEGAAAFQNLYKQAQIEQALGQIVAQNEALVAKVAAFEKEAAAKEAEHKAALAAKQAELDRIAAEEREQQKFAALASMIENRLMDRMRSEVLGSK